MITERKEVVLKYFEKIDNGTFDSTYFKNFNIIVSDKYIIVEGQEGGETKEGIKWPDNKKSFGKFCNVFEFEGSLIKRVHIYVDPDFTSEDAKRIEMLNQGNKS